MAVTGNEIISVDEHCWHVLKKPADALLRFWHITSDLDSFDRDLLIRRKH